MHRLSPFHHLSPCLVDHHPCRSPPPVFHLSRHHSNRSEVASLHRPLHPRASPRLALHPLLPLVPLPLNGPRSHSLLFTHPCSHRGHIRPLTRALNLLHLAQPHPTPAVTSHQHKRPQGHRLPFISPQPSPLLAPFPHQLCHCIDPSVSRQSPIRGRLSLHLPPQHLSPFAPSHLFPPLPFGRQELREPVHLQAPAPRAYHCPEVVVLHHVSDDPIALPPQHHPSPPLNLQVVLCEPFPQIPYQKSRPPPRHIVRQRHHRPLRLLPPRLSEHHGPSRIPQGLPVAVQAPQEHQRPVYHQPLPDLPDPRSLEELSRRRDPSTHSHLVCLESWSHCRLHLGLRACREQEPVYHLWHEDCFPNVHRDLPRHVPA